MGIELMTIINLNPEPKTEKEIDQYLRWCGYDPQKVAERFRKIAQDALDKHRRHKTNPNGASMKRDAVKRSSALWAQAQRLTDERSHVKCVARWGE